MGYNRGKKLENGSLLTQESSVLKTQKHSREFWKDVVGTVLEFLKTGQLAIKKPAPSFLDLNLPPLDFGQFWLLHFTEGMCTQEGKGRKG